METGREILFKKSGFPNLLKIPWLRTEEAAAYCGMSLVAFEDYSEGLSRGGDPDVKLYHVDHLDLWMEDRLETPFPYQAVSRPRQLVFRREVNDLRELDRDRDMKPKAGQ